MNDSTPRVIPPDLTQASDDRTFRPSWSGFGTWIDGEHQGVYERTKEIPGWQDPPDSHKLYEMAFHNGDVILEIGVYGGRSCVVELLGALAGAAHYHRPPPQWFGLDVAPDAFKRTEKTLTDWSMHEYTVMYHGDLRQFVFDIPITPTMVFIDADHRYPALWADLHCLSKFVVPGTSLLCHDVAQNAGMKAAVNEWVERGFYFHRGGFAGSVLLEATDRVSGTAPTRLKEETFAALRESLRARYAEGFNHSRHVQVADLTEPIRQELEVEFALRPAESPHVRSSPTTG